MKFFVPKSYQLTGNKKWIPAAAIIEGSNITEPYFVREKECNIKEEADSYITEICVKNGMQRINQKEYCENLYNKYKELVEKTKLEVHGFGPGGKIIHPIPNIDPKDMGRKTEVKEELHDCLNLLTDEQLKEIFNDIEFMGDATKILAERKRTNQF